MNKSKLRIFTVLLVLLSIQYSFCFAQKQGQEKIDSMLTALKTSFKTDTAKVNLLDDIAWEYQDVSPDEGISFALQGQKLAQKLSFAKGICKSYLSMGSCYYVKSDYEKALLNFNKALDISEAINDKSTSATIYLNLGNLSFNQSDFPKTIDFYNKALKALEASREFGRFASVYGNLGNVYLVKGDYPKSLDYQLKSLESAEKSNNLKVQGNALVGIGNVYSRIPDYPKAIDYYYKSLKIFELSGNKKGSAYSYGSVGVIYYRQKNYKNAIDNFCLAEKFSILVGDKRGTGITYTNIGNIYTDQKLYKKALEYHLKALSVFKLCNSRSNIASAQNNLGNVYTELNDYPQAIFYYKNAYDLNVELGIKSGTLYSLKGMGTLYLKMVTGVSSSKTADPEFKRLFNNEENLGYAIKYSRMAVVLGKELNESDPMMEAYYNISKSFRLKNNWEYALLYSDSARALQDSMFNSENEQKIAEIEARRVDDLHDTEMKIINLNVKNQRIAIAAISLGLLLMILFALLIYRSLMIKKKYNNLLEAEVQARTAELVQANKSLQKAKEEVEVLDHAKSEFLNILYHEIRTPLNGILGSVDILKTSDSPDTTKMMVDILDQSVHRLETFSLKTLDISVLRTQGNKVLRPHYVDISKLVSDVCDMHIPAFQKKGIFLEINSSGTECFALVDESYFIKCLNNIIENAIHHSPENGKIHVETFKHEALISINVIDQGQGFTKKLLDSPLIPFNVNNHLVSDSGLGLYLTSLIAEAHKGSLDIGNNEAGGAFVKVNIPS
ncbi:MAG: tetratricopeptide repeat-containing sensor histidine kinase [Bacteroidota bacterium]